MNSKDENLNEIQQRKSETSKNAWASKDQRNRNLQLQKSKPLNLHQHSKSLRRDPEDLQLEAPKPTNPSKTRKIERQRIKTLQHYRKSTADIKRTELTRFKSTVSER